MSAADIWKLAHSCGSVEEFAVKLVLLTHNDRFTKQDQNPNLALIASTCKNFSEFQRKMAILEGRD